LHKSKSTTFNYLPGSYSGHKKGEFMEYVIAAIILIFLISFFTGSIPGLNNRNRY